MRKLYVSTLRGLFAAISAVVMLAGIGLIATASVSHAAPRVPSTAEANVDSGVIRAGASLLLRSKQLQSAVTPYYIVQRSDTLSKIAAREYGHQDTWPALWWINRHLVPNPNSVRVGERLVLSSWHPVLAWLLKDALGAGGEVNVTPVATSAFVKHSGMPAYAATYSFSGLEALWEGAGGPYADAWAAAKIAECESGGRINAYNPSGASGLWQILGAPRYWTGSTDWFNPFTNALAAVAKFRQAGDSFAPWVCQA